MVAYRFAAPVAPATRDDLAIAIAERVAWLDERRYRDTVTHVLTAAFDGSVTGATDGHTWTYVPDADTPSYSDEPSDAESDLRPSGAAPRNGSVQVAAQRVDE